MNKSKLNVLLLMLFSFQGFITGQSVDIYDRFGKKYSIEEISKTPANVGAGRNSSNTVNSVAPMICGFFELDFEAGCGMDGTSPLDIARRNVLCQVFTDVSNFINSPLTSNTNPQTNKVKILVRDVNNMVSSSLGLLGIASPYFVTAPQSGNTMFGSSSFFYDHEVWKTINTGINSFANNGGLFPGNLNTYHGAMAFVFPPNGNSPSWNYLNSPPAANEYDLYTVALHEVGHLLGFFTLIGSSGTGTGYGATPSTTGYYSRYDSFLKAPNGLPLITQLPGCGPKFVQYNQQGTPAFNTLSPGNPGCGTLPSPASQPNTNCASAIRFSGTQNIPVFTPPCFNVSSLSHLSDQCWQSNQNNMYFVMSSGTAIGSMKRYFKPEERTIICDLGYNLNSTFGNPSNLNFYNYGGTCNRSVAGVNDGVTGGNMYNLITSVNSPITISPLGNDIGANSFTCLQQVLGAGSISNNFGSNFTYIPSINGLHMLQYFPVSSSGKKGNMTYIYIFVKDNCPANCSLTGNSGFENGTGCGASNGYLWGVQGNPQAPHLFNLDCWYANSDSPDLYTRNCNSSYWGTIGNLPTASGINSPNWPTPGNNRIMGMLHKESIQNQLSSPLIPGNQYQISFNVIQAGTMPVGPNLIVAGCDLPSGPGFGPGVSPVTLATIPNYYTLITNYQVNNTSWVNYSAVFTYNALSPPANYVTIFNGSPNSNGFMIDDFTIIALGTPNGGAAFTLPAQMCSNQSIANLSANIFPANAIAQGGYFTGPGIQNVGGIWSLNLTNVPTGINNYSFVYTNPNTGCVYTTNAQVNVLPPANVTITGPSFICANISGTGNNITLTANASQPLPAGVTYNWSIGGTGQSVGTGQSINVNPTSSTTYVVNVATSCLVTNNYLVTVSNSCCQQSTLPTYNTLTSNVIPTNANLSGQVIINQNTTIGTTPGWVYFSNAEFLIAPGVNLTIPPGVKVQMTGAHLYGCSNTMWQGIVVQDGGLLQAIYNENNPANATLIEDAIVAVDIDGYTGSYPSPPVELFGTVFNKNYKSIRVTNSNQTYLPLIVRRCVFTSRNLPFTPTSWPNSKTTGGLRQETFTGAMQGLAPPFDLLGYSPVNLKIPFNTQPANTGIEIQNFGNISGSAPTNGVDVGQSNFSQGGFNLFDNLGIGIDVTDASMSTMNNVFQNMLYFSTPSGMFGGKAIRHNISATSLMNARLNLSPIGSQYQNTNYGNRFWNCYGAVDAKYIYDFSAEYATIRSNQQTTNTNFGPGAIGIILESNRFRYLIKNCEFNNLSYGIWLNTNSGNYNMGSGVINGIYAANIDIKENYFGAHVNSSNVLVNNEYLRDAIHINTMNSNNWQIIGSGSIQSNKIDRAFRGITINGMGTYGFDVSGNTINLADDVTFGQLQYGIQALSVQGPLSIMRNSLNAVGPANQLVTLVHCRRTMRSLIECNDLSSSFQAFEFEGQNPLTIWGGNMMQNHERGLVLSNNGSIGPQGSPVTNDNQWNGVWGAPFSYETFVLGGSNANNSPLFIQGGAPFYPFNNGNGGGTPYNSTCLNVIGGPPYLCKSLNLPAPPNWRTSGSGNGYENTKEENLLQRNVDLFPNPSSGNLTIVGLQENEHSTINITEVTGKVVYSQKTINATTDLDISSLSNGIYLVEIQSGGAKLVKKLLLAK
jgi:hypothetical protein